LRLHKQDLFQQRTFYLETLPDVSFSILEDYMEILRP